MNPRFTLDGNSYELRGLSPEGQDVLNRLNFTSTSLHELRSQLALLKRAKNAYIEDLKLEIVRGRTGINISDLFDDD
jgi:hypothetical protein